MTVEASLRRLRKYGRFLTTSPKPSDQRNLDTARESMNGVLALQMRTMEGKGVPFETSLVFFSPSYGTRTERFGPPKAFPQDHPRLSIGTDQHKTSKHHRAGTQISSLYLLHSWGCLVPKHPQRHRKEGLCINSDIDMGAHPPNALFSVAQGAPSRQAFSATTRGSFKRVANAGTGHSGG